MNTNRARSIRFAAFALALLFGATCHHQSTRPPDSGYKPRIRYTYERPPGVGAPPSSAALVMAVKTPEQAVADAPARATQLAQALGVPLDPTTARRKMDRHNEIFRLSDNRYRVKVYVPSGMAKYRDTHLYNRLDDPDAAAPALRGSDAVARARDVVNRLAAAGLVRPEELLIPAARVYHRTELQQRGAQRGEKNPPPLGNPVAGDTRVFIPRVINGVPVSGHGVRVVLTKRGEIAGVDLLWRELTLDSKRQSVALSMDMARQRFESELSAPANATVNVSVAEFGYADPGMRDPVAFLEPSWLFLYEVRTPTGRPNESRVSKLLQMTIPAIRHGRQQLVSPRDLRIAEIKKSILRNRPAKLARPQPAQDDDETPRKP